MHPTQIEFDKLQLRVACLEELVAALALKAMGEDIPLYGAAETCVGKLRRLNQELAARKTPDGGES